MAVRSSKFWHGDVSAKLVFPLSNNYTQNKEKAQGICTAVVLVLCWLAAPHGTVWVALTWGLGQLVGGAAGYVISAVAAPIHDGERVVAAVNVNTHAAETTVERLTEHHLPLLLRTAGEIGADLARLRTLPQVVG